MQMASAGVAVQKSGGWWMVEVWLLCLCSAAACPCAGNWGADGDGHSDGGCLQRDTVVGQKQRGMWWWRSANVAESAADRG